MGKHRAILLALLLWICVCHGINCTLSNPPVVKVTETDPFRRGAQIGKAMREMIQAYVYNSSNMQPLLDIYNGEGGHAMVDQFRIANKRAYPEYYREIEGTAAGANVPVLYIELINFSNELLYSPNDTHCTDIHVASENFVIGHNEDNDGFFRDFVYFIDTRALPAGNPQYFALTYAGQLPGEAFGFNSQGVVITMNSCFPTKMIPGLSLAFVTYDVISSATSASDAITRTTVMGQSLGYSMNIGDTSTKTVYNVEVAENLTSVYQVHSNYSHQNEYRRLAVSQYPDESSVERLERINQFAAPTNATAVLEILGDTKNTEYPIYRDGAPPDTGVVTLATAIFDLGANSVAIFLGNPKLCTPIITTTIS